MTRRRRCRRTLAGIGLATREGLDTGRIQVRRRSDGVTGTKSYEISCLLPLFTPWMLSSLPTDLSSRRLQLDTWCFGIQHPETTPGSGRGYGGGLEMVWPVHGCSPCNYRVAIQVANRVNCKLIQTQSCSYMRSKLDLG